MKRLCLKCGKEYSIRPALSRSDNHTPICPECGIREALDTIGCLPEEQDHILNVIHEYEELHELQKRSADE